jgi:hypothetical protein
MYRDYSKAHSGVENDPRIAMVSRTAAECIAAANVYRRYGSAVTVSSRIRDAGDVSVRHVGYNVGT